jgi:hypothetical protein
LVLYILQKRYPTASCPKSCQAPKRIIAPLPLGGEIQGKKRGESVQYGKKYFVLCKKLHLLFAPIQEILQTKNAIPLFEKWSLPDWVILALPLIGEEKARAVKLSVLR